MLCAGHRDTWVEVWVAAPTPSMAAPAELPARARMVGAQSTTWASWANLGTLLRPQALLSNVCDFLSLT